MRILAIGAHPDDLEIGCAGTLALYAAAGHTVTMAIATDGGIGHPTAKTRSEVVATRHKEALASTSLIGAELIWMGFEDEWLFNNRETRTRFIDAYREANPDVVITHATNDYHPDHSTTGRIAIDARMPAGIRLLETALPAMDHVPHLFMMDNVGSVDFTPDCYVDISSVIDTKTEMLTCHESQSGWLDHFFGMEYVDFMQQANAKRGTEAGVKYAEGFRELKSFPVTGTRELLPGSVITRSDSA